MINIEKERLEAKLALWNTRGFLWFLKDLEAQKGSECSLLPQVGELYNKYKARLKELDTDPKQASLEGFWKPKNKDNEAQGGF